jgi:hypothetical protein
MARSFNRQFLASCAGLSILAACGAPPTSTAVPEITPITPAIAATATPKPAAKATKKPAATSKTPAKTTPASAKPTATASAKPAAKPSAAPTPAATDATQTLTDLKNALAGISTNQSWNTVTDIKKVGGTTTTTKSLTRFQSPGAYRIEVLDSSNSAKIGNRAVFTYGDKQAKVKAGGVLGIITLTLPMSDSKLLSANGWQLNQFVVKGLLDRLAGGGYKATLTGKTTVSGTDLQVVKVTSEQNSLDADIAYELIGYDSEMRVRLWAVYGKPSLGLAKDLMYQMVTEKIEDNISLPADTFKL